MPRLRRAGVEPHPEGAAQHSFHSFFEKGPLRAKKEMHPMGRAEEVGDSLPIGLCVICLGEQINIFLGLEV